jgi:hypothetical protein
MTSHHIKSALASAPEIDLNAHPAPDQIHAAFPRLACFDKGAVTVGRTSRTGCVTASKMPGSRSTRMPGTFRWRNCPPRHPPMPRPFFANSLNGSKQANLTRDAGW